MLDTATMPVAAQTRVGRPGNPCVMVIFGAAGDLTRRKLVPALYNLARNQLLSREFAVLGIAHSSMSEEEFRKKVVEDVRQYTGNDGDPDLIEWFIRHMYYVTGEFEDKNIYMWRINHSIRSGSPSFPVYCRTSSTTFFRNSSSDMELCAIPRTANSRESN